MNRLKLLLIDCSPRAEHATSRHLTQQLLPGVAERLGVEFQIIRRHLGQTPLPPITEEYAASVLLPLADARSRFGDALAVSDELVKEVAEADVLWIATPVHNYTIPAVLKNWIDLVVRRDVTFVSTKEGKVGLLRDRPTYVAITSGGAMFEEPPRQPDYLRPYLTAILGTIGLKDLTFITATHLAFTDDARSAVETKASDWLADFTPSV